MFELCSVHKYEHFTRTCTEYIYGKLYTFHSFWALNSKHIISEAPSLIQLDANNHNLELVAGMVEVCSVHMSMSNSHVHI